MKKKQMLRLLDNLFSSKENLSLYIKGMHKNSKVSYVDVSQPSTSHESEGTQPKKRKYDDTLSTNSRAPCSQVNDINMLQPSTSAGIIYH